MPAKGHGAAMQRVRPDNLPEGELLRPPTEDELPYSDDLPMDSPRHRLQMNLLIETLELHWADREDIFVGGDMFLYFSLDQVRDRDFRGPDFFVVLGTTRRERKSWVVWQEGKGPDLIIELLSDSMATVDKGERKRVYQDDPRVPEYFWYDPFSGELAGFTMRDGVYEAIPVDAGGRLLSNRLGLMLTCWQGTYGTIEATWLRWMTPDGTLLPTSAERTERAEQRIAQLEDRIARLESRAGRTPDE
ncbi:MAG: Uma2 family endonuclease [Dehalococcoidia bacterium]